jgi:hypothetical protein
VDADYAGRRYLVVKRPFDRPRWADFGVGLLTLLWFFSLADMVAGVVTSDWGRAAKSGTWLAACSLGSLVLVVWQQVYPWPARALLGTAVCGAIATFLVTIAHLLGGNRTLAGVFAAIFVTSVAVSSWLRGQVFPGL